MESLQWIVNVLHAELGCVHRVMGDYTGDSPETLPSDFGVASDVPSGDSGCSSVGELQIICAEDSEDDDPANDELLSKIDSIKTSKDYTCKASWHPQFPDMRPQCGLMGFTA